MAEEPAANTWAAPTAAAAAEVSAEIREQARSAWAFGIAAMGLAMVAPCGSYITLFGALPLGLVALTRARRLLEGATPLDDASEVYARTARLTGLLAALWSGVLLAMLAAFVLLYAGMFAMIFATAATAPPASP